MFNLEEMAGLSLAFTLPMGWLIATKFKMWEFCFAGYWIVTALLGLLIIKMVGLIAHDDWVVFHLLSLNAIVYFVLVYGLVRIYITNHRRRRKSDRG